MVQRGIGKEIMYRKTSGMWFYETTSPIFHYSRKPFYMVSSVCLKLLGLYCFDSTSSTHALAASQTHRQHRLNYLLNEGLHNEWPLPMILFSLHDTPPPWMNPSSLNENLQWPLQLELLPPMTPSSGINLQMFLYCAQSTCLSLRRRLKQSTVIFSKKWLPS